MISSQQLPRKIKHLEVISKALLLILPLSVIFSQICGNEYKFYILYKNITPLIWLFLLLLAIVLKIISISLQKKSSLPINQSIRNFLKLLLPIIFLSGLLGAFFSSPCTSAKDARIKSTLSQAKIMMDSIYEIDNNYDNFNCEYEIMTLICQDISQLLRKNPLIGIESWYTKNERKPVIIHDTRSNSQAVCIYSPLNTKENYWYCVDSSGRTRETEINPDSLGYCVEGESAVCP